MIEKPIDEITKEDIEALIQNEVLEKRTIEYKREIPGDSDENKREFLADISSFANAAGGDLLFGISAAEGVPKEAKGLNCEIDSLKLRLENIIRDGIAPRIPGVRMEPIEGFPEGPIIIIRIPKSWAAPHMVKFKNLSRFFTRNSAGKHQMDVTEIKSAFLLSEALPEKIRSFRDKRLGRIIADEAPVSLCSGGRLVLHILPIASFTSDYNLDISTFKNHSINLPPMGGGNRDRFNFDGFLTYDKGGGNTCSPSYCQIFRRGQIEAVLTDFLKKQNDSVYIASTYFEKKVIIASNKYAGVLKQLGVPCPLIILLSLVGVSGALMMVRPGYNTRDDSPIDRDTLLLPDLLIEDYSILSDPNEMPKEMGKAFRPTFDAVWNACGYEHSLNYDTDGNWKAHQ